MDEILFKIIYLIMVLIIALVAKYLVPYLTSKIEDTKFIELRSFIRNAIAWAESAIEGSGMGAEKFDLVLEKVTSWINQKHIKITEEQVRILIQGIFTELDGYTVNKGKTIE